MPNKQLSQNSLPEIGYDEDTANLYLGDRNQTGGMQTKRTRCAMYLRVSDNEQEEEMQIRFIKELVHLDGFDFDKDVTPYIDHGVSATYNENLEDRDAGKELIQDIEAGIVTELYAYRIDRLFRSVGAGDAFVKKCIEKWPKLSIRTSDAPSDLTSVEGRFLWGLHVLLAQREAHLTSHRTKGGMQNTAEQLGKVSGVVWGWKEVDGRMEPHWHQQAIREWIEAPNDMSSNQMASKLNARGIKTATGRKWSASTIYSIRANRPKYQDQLHQFDRPQRMISYPFRTYKL